MAEQATTQESPEVVTESSFEDKLAQKLGLVTEEEKPEPEAAADEATPVEDDGELAADELPEDEQAPGEGEWLELDRKGEKRKVSKEEAKRLAQQGWDYSQNQERLKAEEKALTDLKAAVTAKAQITPQIVDAAATVKSYQAALAPYQNVNWVQLAQSDPNSYAQYRAHFDQLREGMQQAVGQFQQAAQTVQQVDAEGMRAELQRQMSKLLDAEPTWRDKDKFSADAGRIRQYLGDMGVSEQEINQVADARFLLICRDAMRYRQALKARAEKQAAPKDAPGLRPGAAPQRRTVEVEKAEAVKQLRQAKDPSRKTALLDRALELKLSKFIPS